MSEIAQRKCDGCGMLGSELPLIPLEPGTNGLDYCEQCMPLVRRFLSEVDGLYQQCQSKLASDLNEVRARYPMLKAVPFPPSVA
jgi:hypothetical protein